MINGVAIQTSNYDWDNVQEIVIKTIPLTQTSNLVSHNNIQRPLKQPKSVCFSIVMRLLLIYFATYHAYFATYHA